MRSLFDAFYVRETTVENDLSDWGMPEVLFTVELPDGVTRECYSPSTVVCRYFAKGEEMPIAEFVRRSRRALAEASERVRAKFGFGCGSAAAQLTEIEQWTRSYAQDAVIRIISI